MRASLNSFMVAFSPEENENAGIISSCLFPPTFYLQRENVMRLNEKDYEILRLVCACIQHWVGLTVLRMNTSGVCLSYIAVNCYSHVHVAGLITAVKASLLDYVHVFSRAVVPESSLSPIPMILE